MDSFNWSIRIFDIFGANNSAAGNMIASKMKTMITPFASPNIMPRNPSAVPIIAPDDLAFLNFFLSQEDMTKAIIKIIKKLMTLDVVPVSLFITRAVCSLPKSLIKFFTASGIATSKSILPTRIEVESLEFINLSIRRKCMSLLKFPVRSEPSTTAKLIVRKRISVSKNPFILPRVISVMIIIPIIPSSIITTELYFINPQLINNESTICQYFEIVRL